MTVIVLVLFIACNPTTKKSEGWKLLFDGETTNAPYETGSDYAMYIAGENKKVNLSEGNSSMIKFTEAKAEYWLNGGKWDQFPDYGIAKKGKISLQDHGSKIWFKNVKIKEL